MAVAAYCREAAIARFQSLRPPSGRVSPYHHDYVWPQHYEGAGGYLQASLQASELVLGRQTLEYAARRRLM
eukprot:scaffold218271_cov36-Tisochrysis_lutea.AAC.2